MKTMRFLTTMVVLTATLSSCTKENVPEVPKETGKVEKLILKASIEVPADTRAVLMDDAEGLKTHWTQGDWLYVYNKTTGVDAIFDMKDMSADSISATFSGEIDTTGDEFYLIHSANGMDCPIDLYDDDGNTIGIGFRAPDLGYYYEQKGNASTDNLKNFAIIVDKYTRGDTDITLRHTMAFLKFKLSLPAGSTLPDEFDAYIYANIPTNRYPSFSFDAWDYVHVDTWGFPQDMWFHVTDYDPSDYTNDNTIVSYMAVFPSDLSNKDVNVKVEITDLTDGGNLGGKYSIHIPAKTDRKLEGGHYYIIDQTLVKDTLSIKNGDFAVMSPEEF